MGEIDKYYSDLMSRMSYLAPENDESEVIVPQSGSDQSKKLLLAAASELSKEPAQFVPSSDYDEKIKHLKQQREKFEAQPAPKENIGAELIKMFGAPLLSMAGGEAAQISLPQTQAGIQKLDEAAKEKLAFDAQQRARSAEDIDRKIALAEAEKQKEKALYSEGLKMKQDRFGKLADIASKIEDRNLRASLISQRQQEKAEKKQKEMGGEEQIPGFKWNQKTDFDKTELRQMRDAVADKNSLMQTMGRVKQLVAESNPADLANPYSEKSKEIRNNLRDAQLLYKGKAFAELGVLTGPDLKILEDVIENPNAMNMAIGGGKQGLLKRYDEAMNRISSRIGDKLKVRGFQPAQQEQAKEQKEVKIIGGQSYEKTKDGWKRVK